MPKNIRKSMPTYLEKDSFWKPSSTKKARGKRCEHQCRKGDEMLWKIKAKMKQLFDKFRMYVLGKWILRKRCMYANHMNPAVEYVPARVRPRRRTANKLDKNQKYVWKKKPQNSERNSVEKHWKIHRELMHESWRSTKKTMLGKDTQKVLKMMPTYSKHGSQKLKTYNK